MTWQHEKQWINDCSKLVRYQATEENPEGLRRAGEWYSSRLQQLGFELQFIHNPKASYRPLIVAIRHPFNGEKRYVGFFQHYDVELLHKSWERDPWALTESKKRVYGRGIADNIGPFVHRLLLIEHTPLDIGLVFVIQGEEEIGSPFANQKYPDIILPKISLWIEETGYFYKNGSQRVMTVGAHPLLNEVVSVLEKVNVRYNTNTRHRKRPLNKAFGAEKCPCLTYLLEDRPYLAIGPNDDHSAVHGPNESISLKLLKQSAEQLKAVLKFMEGQS